MWILIIKLLYTKLEFYPEVEFQIWVQGNFIISVHAISGDVKLTLVESNYGLESCCSEIAM